jgi:hypothetical protein
VDEDKRVIIDENPGRAEYVLALVEGVFRFGAVQRAMKEANELYPPGMLYNNAMSLLRNPMLYGKYHEVEGFVEKPLMTKKRWEKLQALLDRNARETGERLLYIFAGLMTCACCGRKMAGTHTTKTTKKGGEQDYKYYRCRLAKVQGTCTNKGSFNEEKLEQDLMEYIKTSVAEQIVKVKEVKQNRKPKKAKKSNRASIEKQLDKLEDLYISDDRMTVFRKMNANLILASAFQVNFDERTFLRNRNESPFGYCPFGAIRPFWHGANPVTVGILSEVRIKNTFRFVNNAFYPCKIRFFG